MIFKAIRITGMIVFAGWVLSSAARAATCSNASLTGRRLPIRLHRQELRRQVRGRTECMVEVALSGPVIS